MCTAAQIKDITTQLANVYRNIYGDDIVKILLYGSYARNEESNQSDVDIVAIVKGKRIDLQKKLKKVWEISADIGYENDIILSPTVVPFDEYEKYRNILPYYMNIEKEGIKIV